MPAPPVGSAPEKHNTTGGFVVVIVFVAALNNVFDRGILTQSSLCRIVGNLSCIINLFINYI